MKLEMIKGKVACSLENKDHDFLSDCTGCFNGFTGYGYLKMNYAARLTEEWSVRENYKTLKTILFYADLHGIEADDEVKAQLELWRERIEEWDRQARERSAKYVAMEKWRRLKERGCGRCKHCRSTGYEDDYVCDVSGEFLPIKNIGMADKEADATMQYCINVLYCMAPFPTDGCLYKTETLDVNDKDYLAWKDEDSVAGF